MVINSYQSQILTYTFIHDKATTKAICLFWAFSSLDDLSRETFHAFWSRSCTPTYLCYSYTGDMHPYMHSIHYCSMRIKVTSLCCLTSKERHGLQKKYWERIKEQKALVFKRERESEKKKSSHASQKEAREGKLLKGVPLPPNIPHTCTSWSICMICCSL